MIAIVTVSLSTILGLIVIWIKWSIGVAVRNVVNGRVDMVKETVDRIDKWTATHDMNHSLEQTQLLSALHRQGVEAPDGWAEGKEGHQK